MKIVKKLNKQTKLCNLNERRKKITSSKKKGLEYNQINNLEFKFKNAFNIIFQFHSKNKKILFLGTPLKLNKPLKKLFKNTKHSFIPEKIWVSGILTNTKYIFKFLYKKSYKKNKNYLKFLFSLTTKNNLIVILNEYVNKFFLKELSKTKIPTISLNYHNTNMNSYNSAYKIKQNLNNIENKSINNFFFSILATILKKAEKVRIKTIQFDLEQKIIKQIREKNKKKFNYKKKKFYHKNAFFKKK